MVFPPGPPPVLQIFLNRALERGRVGPNHFAHLLPVLEQQERRHRTDAELLGHVGDVVDVEFVEARGGVDIGEFNDLRSDDLTRSAPRREAVEYHQALLFQRRIEIGFVLEVVHALLRHGGGKLSQMGVEGLVEGLLDAGGGRESMESRACED